MFTLDPAFEATSQGVCRLPLCEARLQDDARWPWLVLIPRREGLVELDDLGPYDRARLMEEAVLAGVAARAVGQALGVAVDKLNTGALGNLTRQLHVHVVGRRAGDPAWPGPVWGFGAPTPYAPDALRRALEAARRALGG